MTAIPFKKRMELMQRHRKAIYPHGYLACNCGAAKGERCLHRLVPNLFLNNAHVGRRPAPGFGFKKWIEETWNTF